MARAWGVDSNENVTRVFRDTLSRDGQTYGGMTIRLPAEGVIPSARHIGARISGGRPYRIHRAGSAVRANNAFWALDQQFRVWARELLEYGSDVSTPGIRYLASAYQAAKYVLATTGTYTDAEAETMFNNTLAGATDVTSPADFAASAYAARSTAAPTRALSWGHLDGRTALSAMVDFTALTEEPPFTRPTVMRS